MANWKYTLNISPIWENKQTSVEEKGKQIASMIKHKFPISWLYFFEKDFDQELEDIVEGFENITGYDEVTPVEEFDDWMEALYNWSDQEIAPFGQWPKNKMCWVKLND